MRNALSGFAPATLIVLALGGAAPAAETTVRGAVVKADAGAKQLTLRPAAGPDVTLAVTDASVLEVGGKKATVGDLKPGQRVRATYTERAGVKEVVVLRPAVTTADLKSRVKQTLAAAKSYTFQHKGEYQTRLRGMAADVDDRLDSLEVEAQGATGEAKARLQTQIATLKKKRAALNDHLDAAESATADTWDELKTGAGKAASDLESTLHNIFKD